MILLALLLAAPAVPAVAQAAPPAAAVESLDPDRLAAAKKMIDTIMPADHREEMIDSMLRPMMANMQQTIASSPELQRDLADPAKRQIFDRFLAKQNERTLTQLRQGLPGMIAAMTRAYARRFTVKELEDAQAFFETPSGRAYMAKGMTIMSDPDVQAWQRGLMTGAMANMQSDIAELAAEMEKAK